MLHIGGLQTVTFRCWLRQVKLFDRFSQNQEFISRTTGPRLIWMYFAYFIQIWQWQFKFLDILKTKLKILICRLHSTPSMRLTLSRVARGGAGDNHPPDRNSAPLLPPNEITLCTEVDGEPPFWVPVSPPAHPSPPLPLPHFEKSDYAPVIYTTDLI